MNSTDNTVSAFSMYKKNSKSVKNQHKRKNKNPNAPTSPKEQNNKGNIRQDSDKLQAGVHMSIVKKKRKVDNDQLPAISPSKRVKIDFTKPHLTFEWLIAPTVVEDFFTSLWEKSAVYVSRNCSSFYPELLTTEMLDHIIRNNELFYAKNVDVVSYENGKKETLNQEGRAYPGVLWDYYNNKCSIRIINPQTYCLKLHALLASLQEFFGCMVGVNAYLTPPGSQGFAPHYDDIEAFVLQLEGRKHWKLYSPVTQAEILPRYSSQDFDRNKLKAPFREITLHAGDLLYFPRGTVHEAHTDADSHSLHITVSVYQKTAYIDLLERAVKSALNTAVRLDVDYRKGLPLGYLKHTGYMNSQTTSNIRDEIINNVNKLITKLTDYVSVDSAVDELGKQFMWDAMPPIRTKTEESCMIYENSERLSKGVVYNKVSITVDTKVRLLSYYCLRVVADEDTEDTLRVYYTTENSNAYHGREQQFLVIDSKLAPGLEFIIQNYPKYIKVAEIPIEDDNSKMQIVSDLWERGLLVTSVPLQNDDHLE